ncbi:MAG: ComEC family competence protein, partial [Chitinophagaceae bacterium]|nr:ComEC family competence protein [Chitinophagaceae bacterium]
MAQHSPNGLPQALRVPFWVGAPVIRILLPFAAGIVLGWYLQVPVWVWVAAGITVLSAWLLTYRFAYQSPAAFGMANNLLWVALGAALQLVQNPANSPHYIWKKYEPGRPMLATLEEEPVPKRKSYKAIAQVKQWDSNLNHWVPLHGKVILYFPKTNAQLLPAHGASVVFNKSLQPLANTGNPGAFNYTGYAAHKQWYAQVFLQTSDYRLAPVPLQFAFSRWLTGLRNGLLHTLKAHIHTPDDFGMAAALLTGYREALDEEISLAYAATGTAHIIAISGLHL